MDTSLVDAITERVLQELESLSVQDAPAAPAPSGRKVLLCPGPGPLKGEVWTALREVPGLAWIGAGAASEELGKALGCPISVVGAVKAWDELVSGVEAVVLPTVPLELLSRLATLLVDHPAAAAAIEGVVQGRPVLACSDILDRYRRHAARLPGGLVSVFQQQVRTVEGMGIQLLEGGALASALKGGKARRTSSGVGRDVLTMEDLESAIRAGASVLEVPIGTIITPLAREGASTAGIEVRFR
ncbi:MAG: hypothetical protein HY319_05020 [Armatimonadetes bacterium]|nr:hypothetical protein [Armatimonadota bacterium]